MPKNKLERKHENSTDFILNGKNVDVKTTRKRINNKLPALRYYSGIRLPNIAYAMVEFSFSGVRISLESKTIAELNASDVAVLYNEWLQNRRSNNTFSPTLITDENRS